MIYLRSNARQIGLGVLRGEIGGGASGIVLYRWIGAMGEEEFDDVAAVSRMRRDAEEFRRIRYRAR